MNWEKIRINVPTIGKLGKLSESDKRRIESYTIINTNGCWIWIGTQQDNKKGHQYGSFWYNGKYVMIHRLMYHNFVEDVPIYERNADTMQVNHKCNSDGKCINPDHLYLGTPKQNTQDCIKDGNKNKAKSGDKNHNSSISNETVEYIKSLKNTNMTQKEIAKYYGINQSQISRWWNNKTRSTDE